MYECYGDDKVLACCIKEELTVWPLNKVFHLDLLFEDIIIMLFYFFIDFCDFFLYWWTKKRKPQEKCWSYRCCFMFPFDRKDGKEPFSCLRAIKFIAIAVFNSFEMWNSSSKGIIWYVLLCMHWFCLQTSLLFFNQSCQLKESVLIPLNL